MEKAKLQTILHAEVFFDPQAHTRRGVRFADVIEGIDEALQDAGNRLGLSSKLILCFLRDLDTQDAMAIFLIRRSLTRIASSPLKVTDGKPNGDVTIPWA